LLPVIIELRAKAARVVIMADNYGSTPIQVLSTLGETVSHLPQPGSSPPEFRPFGRLKKGKSIGAAKFG
jgi:hypothetical protein